MDGLDSSDARPAYQQVRDRLREEIEDGQLTPGAQLPTHRALAEQYGVAVETVKRALNELRAAGLIMSRQGKGSYVTERQREPRRDRNATELADMQKQIADLSRRLDDIERRISRR